MRPCYGIKGCQLFAVITLRIDNLQCSWNIPRPGFIIFNYSASGDITFYADLLLRKVVVNGDGGRVGEGK